MRRTRLLLATIAAVFLLSVLAAWLVPERLDWNRFRPEIERLSTAQLGREVHIEGPIALTLLPEPIITARAITVAGTAPIRADALRLRVGLGALLAGQIEARELVLRGMDMRVPWPLPAAADYRVRAPTWLAAVSARIEQGRLSIGDLTFDGIEATLTTGAISGSYAAAGVGQLYGRAWRFTARLTQPGGDGSAALDATLDGQGAAQGIGATLSGQLGADGTFGGRVAARGPDLSRLLPAPAVAFSAEGRVSVADGLAAADDLAVEIGGSPARAALALRVTPTPRLDVALAASRIDLDAWLPALVGARATALPLGIDLSAEAAQLAGGTLRRLRAAIDLSGTGAAIREFSALLPGDAKLALTGHLARTAGAPALDADVTLVAPRLRATLDWIGPALASLRPNTGANPGPNPGPNTGIPAAPYLSPDAAREADLKAHVTLAGFRLAANGIAGTLDGARIDGAAAVAFTPRLAIQARLSLDRLALDPWVRRGILDPIDSDLDIVIDAGTATWRGHALTPLHLDAIVEPGRTTLRSLRLAAGGVRASLAGTLVQGGRIADGVLDVAADAAAALTALFPDSFGPVAELVPLMLRLPLHAHAEFAGPAPAVVTRLALDLGDLRIAAEPTIDLQAQNASGSLTMRHPGAPRLAELLGLNGAPAWLGDGSFALVARLAASPGKLAASSLDVSAGSLRATGQLALDFSGVPHRLTGRIEADMLPLPVPYARSPEPLPIPSLRGWQANIALQAATVLANGAPLLDKALATLVVANGTGRLDGLSARLGGGLLTGAVSLDTTSEPRRVAASLALSRATIERPLLGLPIDLVAGMIEGELQLTAAGNAPAGLLATASGTLHAVADTGTLAGLALAPASGDLSEAAIRAGLAGGTTPFDRLDLDAKLDRGQLDLTMLKIEAPSGRIAITGAIDLPNASVALHVAARPTVPDPPEIGLTLTGPLASPVRTPELAGLARWRVARAVPAAPPTEP